MYITVTIVIIPDCSGLAKSHIEEIRLLLLTLIKAKMDKRNQHS